MYLAFAKKRKRAMWNHLQDAITNNAINQLKALKTTRLSNPQKISKVPSEGQQSKNLYIIYPTGTGIQKLTSTTTV